MRGNLDERLQAAKERARAKAKLNGMLTQAKRVVRDESAKCKDLAEKLTAEEADVEQLEGLSLSAIFATILGSKNARLEKERQEILAAKLKLDEAKESLEDGQIEVSRLEHELADLDGAESEYEQLVAEKEAFLANSDDDRSETLLDLSERLADLNADETELQEAISAGKNAVRALRDVRFDLKSAANWGGLDMFGGGFVSAMAKHSKIDSAKRHAHVAQHRLRRFQEELADAGDRLQVSIEIGGFSKFADFFFDGLIADWVVQSKIRKALDACESVTNRVNTAVNACRLRLAAVEREVAELTEERREFIERA